MVDILSLKYFKDKIFSANNMPHQNEKSYFDMNMPNAHKTLLAIFLSKIKKMCNHLERCTSQRGDYMIVRQTQIYIL